MPLRVTCPGCRATLNINDQMRGRRAQCPKCSYVISIPSAGGTPARRTAAVTSTAMDDLLDEAGVKARPKGRTCPSCGEDLADDAVLCVACGYDLNLGRRLDTYSTTATEGYEGGVRETGKILAKAEQDIETQPLSVDEGEHGDGPESFLVAVAAVVVFAVLVATGIFVIFLFDQLDEKSVNSVAITMGICIVMMLIGKVWLVVVGFREYVGHGIALLLFDPYCPIYGFGRFRGLWLPTVLHLVGAGGAIATYIAFRTG